MQKSGGINLTASRLQFIETEEESNKIFISNIGQTFLSPSINFDESVDEIILPQINNAFDEIKIRNGFKSAFIFFTLPPELFFTIQLPYDSNLNQKEIREEFSWEISELYPFIRIDELALKFYELDNSLLPGKNNALVVALPKKFLVLIKNFCLLNNLQPRLVDNASIAANTFINSVNGQLNRTSGVNLYNSKNSITLFINILSKPAFVKVFTKQKYDVITTVIRELMQEKFNKIFSQTSCSYLISGEDLNNDILMQIEEETKLKFDFFNPFDFIKLKSESSNLEIPYDHHSSFTPIAGIALRFF
jgi:Tfp pilus assembly PilM family ATPase